MPLSPPPTGTRAGNRDTQPPQSLPQAQRRLRANQRPIEPVYLPDGRIRAGIGWYRLARHADGRQALLFGFTEDEIAAHSYPGMPGPVAARPWALKIVEARHGDENGGAPWVHARIQAHQHALAERRMNTDTLYRLGPNRWASDRIVYELDPRPGPGNGGPTGYRLRLWARSRPDEDPPGTERSLCENRFLRWIDMGADLGPLPRERCLKIIRADFQRRVDRLHTGQAPLSAAEKARHPLWLAGRGVRAFLREPRRYVGDAVRLGLKAASGTGMVDMLDLAMDGFGDRIFPRRRRQRRQNPDIGDTLALKATSRGGLRRLLPGGRRTDPLLRKARSEALDYFVFLDAQTARCQRPLSYCAATDLDSGWLAQYLLGAAQGSGTALVDCAANGTTRVLRADGLVIDSFPEEGRLFACNDPRGALPDAPALPPEIARQLPPGHAVEIRIEPDGAKVRHLDRESWHREIGARMEAVWRRRDHGFAARPAVAPPAAPTRPVEPLHPPEPPRDPSRSAEPLRAPAPPRDPPRPRMS